MAKKICALCAKELGALSMKTEIQDGFICLDCFSAAAQSAKIKPGKYKEYSAASLKELINKNIHEKPLVVDAPPVVDTRDKSKCAICEKSFGKLSLKIDLMDGFICFDCVNRAKIKQKHSKEHDTASVVELVKQNAPLFFKNKEREAAFNATKKIDKFLHIDENSKMFRLGKDGSIFNYSDLVGYELIEDNESITKGGISGAVVGGLLAGGVGSVVGAIVGNKSKDICKSMQIAITVKNTYTDTFYITLIGGVFINDIPKSHIVYRDAQHKAQLCLSALQSISDENEPAAPAAGPSVDLAAEIQKFHELKEKGIISEAEFNAKKTQLLGL